MPTEADLRQTVDELRRALEARTAERDEAWRQQATVAEVLRIISSSRGELAPVFQAIVRNAVRICEAKYGHLILVEGDLFRVAAEADMPWELAEYFSRGLFEPTPGSHLDRVRRTRKLSQTADDTAEPVQGVASRYGGARSIITVPMLQNDALLGVILIYRQEVRPFTDQQVALLQNFADQAVIAIENARLIEEVQTRTRDLGEALKRQIANAAILEIINSSPTDLTPVFDAILQKAHALCGVAHGSLQLIDGECIRAVAVHGVNEPLAGILRQPRSIDEAPSVQAMLEGQRYFQIDDVRTSEFPILRASAEIQGARTLLSVPLRREGQLLGIIVSARPEVKPFSEKEISLLESFAAQAAIAIENARLFEEVQTKTGDLTESLQQQIATSEVLQVINSKPGELGPVFQSMLENATRICGANFGALNLFDGEAFAPVAHFNTPPEFWAARVNTRFRPHPESGHGNVALHKEVVQIADLRESRAYLEGSSNVVAITDVAGARTMVIVPMLKETELIGTIAIYRQEVRPFSDKQIALLSNFANQAVIAIENTRLLGELRQRTEDLTRSLDDLRAAQDRLIQTEKLASLGQLTAGIAHEIKNPLNFVNNFSALSVELTDELNALLKSATICEDIRRNVDEVTALLRDNLGKVVQHGKRADSIVKNMLLHSRGGSGEQRPAEINALVDESLNLAYHGARAEKPQFDVTLKRDFDPEAGMIEVFPQEITRVFVNLISNGFYAVSKRKAEQADTAFEPTVAASTRGSTDHVEIRIRDNGTGIPPQVKEKMFDPFFTTKPAGEGTGLGLSISHDIIVKQHGGTIDVDTLPGEFTEFTIVLPRTSNLSKSRG